MNYVLSAFAGHSRIRILPVLCVSSWLLGVSIGELLYVIDPESTVEATSRTYDLIASFSFAEAILIVVILGPFFETILFQIFLLRVIKALTDRLSGAAGWGPSFVLTSVIFAGVHGLGYESIYHGFLMAIPVLPAAFVLSLLAVMEYEREDGAPIRCVFVLHAMYNAIGTIVFYSIG